MYNGYYILPPFNSALEKKKNWCDPSSLLHVEKCLLVAKLARLRKVSAWFILNGV